MKKNFKISIFPTKTRDGIELAQAIEKVVDSISPMLELKIFDRYTSNVTQLDFLEACLEDDLVIFDATREGENNEINNFDIANEHPKSIEHIWVVSRNYLPINFYGVDPEGYPNYKTQTKSNKEILNWIEKKLLAVDFSKPRDIAEKGIKGWHKASERTRDRDYQNKNDQTNIFISFRTKYEYGNKVINPAYRYSVSELAERIRKGQYHSGTPKTAKYLEDGNLVFSTELNTKQRIWQILSIIDRDYIMHCDELWVYGSDDYLNSWWTMGELIIYSFLLHQGIDKRKNKPPRKLMLYNPKTDTVDEIEPFPIDDFISQRITRIQSNCAPGVMGFESVMSLRMMGYILYGNEEQHIKYLNIYVDILMKNILPLTLKDQGWNDEMIAQFLSDEDSKEEIRNMLIPQLQSMKEQVQSGNLSEELRGFYRQLLDIQNQQLPEEMQNILTEDELIKTSMSKEYLTDPVFSEDFWETVVYKVHINNGIKEEELKEKIRNIDVETIKEHLQLNYPEHKTIGNIEELDNHTISQVEGKKLIKKPSRFIFMPTREGSVELSPTHNNLLEMPVYIEE